MGSGIDPRAAALFEILHLAEEDRRRGIQYWFDPSLADSLRALEREARDGGSAPAAAPSAGAGQPGAATSGTAGVGATTGVRSGGTAGVGATIPAAVPATEPGSARPQWGPPPVAEGRGPDWAARLERLRQQASSCTVCGLCRTRHHVVFGTGSGTVPLVFVGEAPGADEDRQGIPFVGRAGQLLTRIIAAIGLRREDVYICNVLKCRPPENRNPAPDEIASCSPFLREQLEILNPKVICTLGLFATQTLLETTAPIGKLRGRLMTHKGMRILPTYHPAALLRNPGLKATVWEDVQLLRRILDE